MAEVAGLVLAVLPIAIWALERYAEPFETFHRYRTTIETFRSQIIIQNYQLEKTLLNLGLNKDATREELRECLETKFPQISRELLIVVQQIDDVSMELIKSLDISIDIKKNQPLDKARWNWSRVKHSLNTKKRDKVLEELRHLNEDLRKAVENTELPDEADSSKIQELKRRFNPQKCSLIRKYLSSLHRALGSGLCCACACPHKVAVDLDWQAYESGGTAQTYNVAISYTSPQPSQLEDSWRKLRVAPYITSGMPASSGTPPRTPSPAPLVTSKFARFTQFLKPHTPPLSQTGLVASSSTEAGGLSSATEIANLCSMVCTEAKTQDLDRYLKDPDKDPDKGDNQLFLLKLNQLNPCEITGAFRLKSLLSPGELLAGKQNPMRTLSAKLRYGIAAAIAWSVLHLGETPWLGESWSEKQANLFLEKVNYLGTGLPSPPVKPYLSHVFSPTLQEEEEEQRLSSRFDELIPNKTIFALGVILIELCMLDARSGSLIEDYSMAVSRLDDVRRTAGSAYGDAAERCIKFSFPGRDIHKKFDMPQFRRQFYNDVVAPVQATYYLMPG